MNDRLASGKCPSLKADGTGASSISRFDNKESERTVVRVDLWIASVGLELFEFQRYPSGVKSLLFL